MHSSRKQSFVILIVLSILIILLIVPSAAAQNDVFSQTLAGVHKVMENKPIMFAILFFLFFFLLYGIFALGLTRSKAFSPEGKLTKTGKTICLTMSGIVVLSVFFVAGPGQVLIRAKEIAHQFNVFFAVILSVLIAAIFRYIFDSEEINGKNMRTFMTVFGLALAFQMFGSLGGKPMFTGLGTTIFIILAVYGTIYLLGGGREEDEVHYNIRAAIPRGYNDSTDEEREEVRERVRHDMNPMIENSRTEMNTVHERLNNESEELMNNTRELENNTQQLMERNEELSQRMAARAEAEILIQQLQRLRTDVRDMVRRVNVFTQQVHHTMTERNTVIENGINQFNDEVSQGSREGITRAETRMETAINDGLNYIHNKSHEFNTSLTTRFEELHHTFDQLLNETEDLDRRTRE
ncbi:hypothetical protein KY336_02190 [Candidatus Woesearchaeota archaeon]|nr:hypothetical protein [Candidatus Woesearchaeota archaeon]